jgi:hypothetical protein
VVLSVNKYFVYILHFSLIRSLSPRIEILLLWKHFQLLQQLVFVNVTSNLFSFCNTFFTNGNIKRLPFRFCNLVYMNGAYFDTISLANFVPT